MLYMDASHLEKVVSNRLAAICTLTTYLSPKHLALEKIYPPKMLHLSKEPILKATDQNSIFCDLAEASDCMHLENLLAKLHFYGIQGTNTHWYRSYLAEIAQKGAIRSSEPAQNFFSNW
jgi:hypothetical protein